MDKTNLQLVVFSLFLACVTVQADVIDFDSLGDGEVVTNQFAGLTFQNATVLTAGISLNEFEFPPRSGSNVIFDNGSPLTIQFASPVLSVSGYFSYLSQLTLTAYDSGNVQVGMVLSAFGNNLALSGEPGSSPNELLSLAHPGGISRITISGDPFGGSFVLDDLAYTGAVPEPSTTTLILIAGCLLAVRLRKSNTI